MVFALERKFDFERALEDGTLFTASHIFTEVPSMGVRYAHITTTSRKVAIKVSVNSANHMTINSYSQSTYTDVGQPVLIAPRRIDTPYSVVSSIRHSPVINQLGTLRIVQSTSGGDKLVTAVGSHSEDSLALIIPAGVDVLLEITNHGQEPTTIGVLANFIEEVD